MPACPAEARGGRIRPGHTALRCHTVAGTNRAFGACLERAVQRCPEVGGHVRAVPDPMGTAADRWRYGGTMARPRKQSEWAGPRAASHLTEAARRQRAANAEAIVQFVDRTPLGGTQDEVSGKLRSVDQHPADVADLTFQRQLDLTARNIAEARMAQVEEALARQREGRYGNCAVCGQPIDPERLRARPEATLCVACQRRQDGGWCPTDGPRHAPEHSGCHWPRIRLIAPPRRVRCGTVMRRPIAQRWYTERTDGSSLALGAAAFASRRSA